MKIGDKICLLDDPAIYHVSALLVDGEQVGEVASPGIVVLERRDMGACLCRFFVFDLTGCEFEFHAVH